MLGLSLALAVGAAVLALLLAWAGRAPGASELTTWAVRYEVELRPEDRDWVRRELRRGRLLRTLGFAAPVGIGMGASVWSGEVSHQSLTSFPLPLTHFAAWATGYLLGATAAELTRRRPGSQPVWGAALVPRRLADYLPSWMPRVARAAALATLLLAPLPHRGAPSDPSPSRGYTSAVAAVAIAAVVELALRSMVSRRQPVATPEELAVDDALRSTAIHRAAGAGLAALLFVLGDQVGNLAGRWQLLSVAAGLACYCLAVGAWRDLSVPMRWPIRRARAAGRSGGPPVSRHGPGRGPA